MSYTTTHTEDDHWVKVEDINRRATSRVHPPRVQRTIGHKSLQQEKSSPTISVTMATDTTKQRQSKVAKVVARNRHLVKQLKPANFSDKISNPMSSIRYKDKKNMPMSEVTDKSQVSRPPLFISDQPVAVMGVNFWMEAGRTRTDEEKQQSEAGFTRHAFNQYASDRLGYFREIPDTRHAL